LIFLIQLHYHATADKERKTRNPGEIREYNDGGFPQLCGVNSPTFEEKSGIFIATVPWHDFYPLQA
jgi:hypothetical protein